MVNFKPGEYIRKMFYSVNGTDGWGVLPTWLSLSECVRPTTVLELQLNYFVRFSKKCQDEGIEA